MTDAIKKLERSLLVEKGGTKDLKETKQAKRLQGYRNNLLAQIHEIRHSGDLSLIVATERTIVEGDLSRYANSQAMTSSLQAAINELSAVERHIGIVDDPARYQAVDQAHRLPKNRKGGLPLDEARQALMSHYTRLNNLDKSRLDDDEKKVIDARKSNLFLAGKLYTERQARILGVELIQGKKRGNH
jgi:hypothetical protein